MKTCFFTKCHYPYLLLLKIPQKLKITPAYCRVMWVNYSYFLSRPKLCFLYGISTNISSSIVYIRFWFVGPREGGGRPVPPLLRWPPARGGQEGEGELQEGGAGGGWQQSPRGGDQQDPRQETDTNKYSIVRDSHKVFAQSFHPSNFKLNIFAIT